MTQFQGSPVFWANLGQNYAEYDFFLKIGLFRLYSPLTKKKSEKTNDRLLRKSLNI